MSKLVKKLERCFKAFERLVKHNQQETILILLIMVIAAFLRFYHLDRLSFFTYDQARDALYIKRIIVDHKFRLIGTQSSIPGLYTGPVYYYLMAPFLWFFKLNPVGLDFATALFGTLTVLLLYRLLKKVTKRVDLSLLITTLYACSPQIVWQSRFAWNPNSTPLFFLFFFWGLLELTNKKNWAWVMISVSLAFLIQLHYSAMVLFPVLLLYLLFFRKRIEFGRNFLISLSVFIILMSPLVLFEFRHNFVNLRAVSGYLVRGTSGEIPPPPFFSGLLNKTIYLLVELPLGASNRLLSSLILLSIFTFTVMALRQKWRQIILVVLCLIGGLLGASVYKGSFFNFYLTLFYPLGFLLIGFLLAVFLPKGRLWLLFLILGISPLFYSNLNKIKPNFASYDQSAELKKIAGIIAKDVGGQDMFNIVSLRGGERYDHNAVDYRYYLESFFGKRALDWDVLDYQKAKTLYLVSHLGRLDPFATGIWEMDLFAPGVILSEWRVAPGVYIYKLGRI